MPPRWSARPAGRDVYPKIYCESLFVIDPVLGSTINVLDLIKAGLEH
jgi:hypothetical protein